MSKINKILKQIGEAGVIPVITLNKANDAEPLSKILYESGLLCAEVTFRTDAAEEGIRIISQKFPDILVGAGTVLTTVQVDRAVAAGAKFIVSPGLNPRIVKYCVEKNILIIPGCSTPSDVEQALENGINVVKFFPAELTGGLAYLKAIAAPYTGVRFIPTGGISPDNVKEYLACDKVLACGGSWLVKRDLIKSGEFDKIKKFVKEAVEIVKESRKK